MQVIVFPSPRTGVGVGETTASLERCSTLFSQPSDELPDYPDDDENQESSAIANSGCSTYRSGANRFQLFGLHRELDGITLFAEREWPKSF
jgi:hypothetical protein